MVRAMCMGCGLWGKYAGFWWRPPPSGLVSHCHPERSDGSPGRSPVLGECGNGYRLRRGIPHCVRNGNGLECGGRGGFGLVSVGRGGRVVAPACEDGLVSVGVGGRWLAGVQGRGRLLTGPENGHRIESLTQNRCFPLSVSCEERRSAGRCAIVAIGCRPFPGWEGTRMAFRAETPFPSGARTPGSL